MKNLILIAVALIAFQATAQDKTMKDKKEPRKERFKKVERMTPEQSATLQTKRMALELDLTEAQQAKIKALNLERAKARKERMEAFKKQRKAGDAERKTLSKDERFERKEAMLDKQIAQKEKMKSILSEEQYTKWEASKQRHGKKARRFRGTHGKKHQMKGDHEMKK